MGDRKPTRASDVLDVHRKLVKSLADPRTVDYLDEALENHLRFIHRSRTITDAVRNHAAQQFVRMYAGAENTDEFCDKLRRSLVFARTYQVTSPIASAVMAMYNKQTSELEWYEVTPEDLPYPQGFVWMDTTYTLTDMSGTDSTLRAFSWAETVTHDGRPGVRVTAWSRFPEMPDELKAPYLWKWYRKTGGDNQLVMLHSTVAPFGQKISMSDDTSDRGNDLLRLIRTIWAFMEMEIVETPVAEVREFSARKFTEQTGSQPEVRVVQLRRVRHPGHEEQGHRDINWSCQWFVAPHHRHLDSYGAEHHRARPSSHDSRECTTCGSRITRVKGHVKGPEGKPLRNLDELFRLSR